MQVQQTSIKYLLHEPLDSHLLASCWLWSHFSGVTRFSFSLIACFGLQRKEKGKKHDKQVLGILSNTLWASRHRHYRQEHVPAADLALGDLRATGHVPDAGCVVCVEVVAAGEWREELCVGALATACQSSRARHHGAPPLGCSVLARSDRSTLTGPLSASSSSGTSALVSYLERRS
jgi:hypothetical protein